MIRRLAFCTALVVAALGLTAVPAQRRRTSRVLVFSKTAGFRHDSIPAGIQAIRDLGTANNFAVEATEDATQFTDTNLARFKAVIWLSTTGDVLNAAQQTAFENYIRAGGGYLGVHAAADTEYDWAWYGGLVGAYFASHPAIQPVDGPRRRRRPTRPPRGCRPPGPAPTSGTTTAPTPAPRCTC